MVKLSRTLSKAPASASSHIAHRTPLILLNEAQIHRQHPVDESHVEKPVFPALSFSLDSAPSSKERWAVVSSDSSAIRSKFLQTLRGQYISVPPVARTWPYLSSDGFRDQNQGLAGVPSKALRYVGFANSGAGSGSSGTQGAYLGARYESRRESTDWSLLDYLRGTVSLNLSETELAKANSLESNEIFSRVVNDLKLQNLLELPVGNLSNGQTRRARIAKALLEGPELLLLDEPFAGLDPVNHKVLSALLREMARRSEPRVLMALQASEPIPDWITHLINLGPAGETIGMGEKNAVLPGHEKLVHSPPVSLKRAYTFKDPEKQARFEENKLRANGRTSQYNSNRMHGTLSEYDKKRLIWSRDPTFVTWDQLEDSGTTKTDAEQEAVPIVDMEGVRVSYGTQCVLGNWQQDVDGSLQEGLHWKVREGERWGVFGANGSGKTTLISLLTSDHPQAYSLPIKMFGRSRLATVSQPGISVFDLQKRIGHSSPEVHTYFPKSFTLRQVIENAWAEAFHGRAELTYENDEQVSAALRWFQHELDPEAGKSSDRVERHFGKAGALRRAMNQWENTGFNSGALSWLEEEPTWAEQIRFTELSMSAQRVALFLRAVIKKPDIVVLDEAFSGMDKQARLKCMMWLAHGETKWLHQHTNSSGDLRPKVDTPMEKLGILRNTGLEPRQALICVSHRKEEIPFVVDRWLRLPEANEGKPVEFGQIDRHHDRFWWEHIWGSHQ